MKRRNLGGQAITQKFFIFTEGKKTEIAYINGYLKNKGYHKQTDRKVILNQPDNHMPYGLLEFAKQSKKDNCFSLYGCSHRILNTRDFIWLCFDKDQHPKISDVYAEARQQNDIGLAFSAICFEYWLMLHFNYTTAAFTCCDNLTGNNRFTSHIPNYEKSIETIFEIVNSGAGSLISAKSNARQVRAQSTVGTAPYSINPYCNVDILIEAIDVFFDTTQEDTQRKTKINDLITSSFS